MVAASYLCLAIHLCFSRVYTTTRHRWAIKRTSSLCSMVYTITGHRCLVVRVRQSLTSGCAEVISEGLVMIRVCDDRALNHNDLPLFAQLWLVRFKATTERLCKSLWKFIWPGVRSPGMTLSGVPLCQGWLLVEPTKTP